jgi:hypothetical protein
VVVTVGETAIEEATVEFGNQVYPNAALPDADMVEVWPGQIIVGLEATATVGPGSTGMYMVTWFVQVPFAPIPVKVVLTKGETTWYNPFKLPGIQVKFAAPTPISVAVVPAHTVPPKGRYKAETVGELLILIVVVPEFWQPDVEVPTAVYVVVAVWETTMLLPLTAPGYHR